MPLFVFSQTTTSRGQCACAALSLANSCSEPVVTGALVVVWCFDPRAAAGAKSTAIAINAETTVRRIATMASTFSLRQRKHARRPRDVLPERAGGVPGNVSEIRPSMFSEDGSMAIQTTTHRIAVI